jgi:CubicO group peptidase (beta-lactamase class C family)
MGGHQVASSNPGRLHARGLRATRSRGINARLRDWGHLGLLLANDGVVDGKQIVPAAWLRAMTRPDAEYLRPGHAGRILGYGYQTWLLASGQFRLWGVRGQKIYVDPQTKVVVVHTSVTANPKDSVPEHYWFFRGVINSVKTP